MKAFASLVVLFGLSAAFVPALVDAQDGKDEPKKIDEKKATDKKADPKKKAIARADEVTVLNAPKLKARVKEIRVDENGADIKEIVVVGADPQKYDEFVRWEQKFLIGLQNAISLETQKKLEPQQINEVYRRETANKLDGVFSGSIKAINVTPAIRIRTADAPPQYNAAGNLKKLTAAELAKLKDRTRFPGYPAEIGAVRVGQIVEVYVPKSAVQPPKQAAPVPAAKKSLIGADPNLVGGAAPPVAKIDAYLIYVLPEMP